VCHEVHLRVSGGASRYAILAALREHRPVSGTDVTGRRLPTSERHLAECSSSEAARAVRHALGVLASELKGGLLVGDGASECASSPAAGSAAAVLVPVAACKTIRLCDCCDVPYVSSDWVVHLS
jgi:hypothetical protein